MGQFAMVLPQEKIPCHFERSEKSAFSLRYKQQISHPMKLGSK